MKNAFIDNYDVDSGNGRCEDKWNYCDLILRERKNNRIQCMLANYPTAPYLMHCRINIAHKNHFHAFALALATIYHAIDLYIYAFKLQTITCVVFVLKTSRKTNNVETNLSMVHQIWTKELVHSVSNLVQSTYSNELLLVKKKMFNREKTENKIFTYMVEWIELERFIFTSARCECTLFVVELRWTSAHHFIESTMVHI